MNILQPHTPLPWKSSVCHQGDSCWCRIIENVDSTEENEVYVNPSGSIGEKDVDFIIQAANNFHEAIKLLKETAISLEGLAETYNTILADDLADNIKSFLEKLK